MKTSLGVALALALVGCSEPEPEHVAYIEASALKAQYAANEVGSDARWKGRLVQVTGYVGDIGKTLLSDVPYVTLGGTPQEMGVDCFLNADRDALNIVRGSHVSYRGHVTGYSLGHVTVRDCVLAKVLSNPKRR